jgi:hypothetical protein
MVPITVTVEPVKRGVKPNILVNSGLKGELLKLPLTEALAATNCAYFMVAAALQFMHYTRAVVQGLARRSESGNLNAIELETSGST